MTTVKICLILAVLLGCVMGSFDIKHGIYNISEEDYEQFVDMVVEKRATFCIKFYSPMCQHCKRLKPIYIEVAKKLENDPDEVYIFAQINSNNNGKLTKQFNIIGLPTILIFSPNNNYHPVSYEGNHTEFEIITGIELAAGLINQEVPIYSEFRERINHRNENVILGLFKNSETKLYKDLQKIKEEFPYVRMYYSYNVEEYKKELKLGDGDEFVLMFHNKRYIEKGDEEFKAYSKDEYSSLKDFLIEEYPYAIEELSSKVESIYQLRHRPLGILFTPFENRTEITKNLALQMKPLGKKFKGKLNIYLEDTNSPVAKKYGFHEGANFMIFDIDKESSKYRYQDKVFQDTIDVDALIEFTQNYIDGKAPRYIRSAEVIKEDLHEIVTPVVSKTFNQIVKDPTKHVFIRYFNKMLQRFDEHFKMRKVWYNVGRHYLAEKRDDFLIAEIEIHDNDVPQHYLDKMEEGHYYFLFTKDNKEDPIIYTGDVDENELIKFAEKHIGSKKTTSKIDL